MAEAAAKAATVPLVGPYPAQLAHGYAGPPLRAARKRTGGP